MSATTTAVAVIVLIALTAGTVAVWARVHGSPWLGWPARVGSLLSCQAGAVLVCALVLNSTFGFYASWSELLGRVPTSAQATTMVGSQDRRLHDELYRHFLEGRGTVVATAMPGRLSHVNAPVGDVYLPPQYGDPAYANRSFPVVQLFDGYPGDPKSWLRGLGITAVLDHSINSGSSAPFIAVMSWQNGPSRRNSDCVNAVHGAQLDTYLTYDVRAAVRAAFRASPVNTQWTALGYSTGGYCALNLALRHPDMFRAAASLAGDDHAVVDWTTGQLFGTDIAARLGNDDRWRLLNLPQPDLNLLLVDSGQDPYPRTVDATIMREARSPLKVSSLSLPRGGHNAQTFDAELPTCLGWLSRYVSAPLAPIPTADGLVPVPNPYLAVGSGQHRQPWRPPTGRSVVTAAHGSTTRSGTANGSTSHGSTVNGSTVNGSTVNGGTVNGGTANGGTVNGSTANGSTTRPAS